MLVFTKKENIQLEQLKALDYINLQPKLYTTCGNNIIFNIMFYRDYLEYSHLILMKYLEQTQNKKFI